jgi:hypothetical protein
MTQQGLAEGLIAKTRIKNCVCGQPSPARTGIAKSGTCGEWFARAIEQAPPQASRRSGHSRSGHCCAIRNRQWDVPAVYCGRGLRLASLFRLHHSVDSEPRKLVCHAMESWWRRRFNTKRRLLKQRRSGFSAIFPPTEPCHGFPGSARKQARPSARAEPQPSRKSMRSA